MALVMEPISKWTAKQVLDWMKGKICCMLSRAVLVCLVLCIVKQFIAILCPVMVWSCLLHAHAVHSQDSLMKLVKGRLIAQYLETPRMHNRAVESLLCSSISALIHMISSAKSLQQAWVSA